MSVVEAHRIDGSKEEIDDGDDDTSEIAAAATPRDVLADFGLLLSAGETTTNEEEIDFDLDSDDAESVIGTSTG